MLAGFQRAFEGGLLAGGQAVKGLVQTVEHGVGAELVAHAFLGVDGLAVNLSSQVDVGEVALGGRAVHADQGAEALTQGLEALVDVLILDFRLGDGDLKTVDFRQFDVRTTLDGGGELQLGLVVGGLRNILHVELRLSHRTNLLLIQGLGVQLRNRVVHGLTGDGGETDALVDDLAGNVALTEAGNVHLLGDFLTGRIQIRVELFRFNSDGELHLGGLEVTNADLHANDSSKVVISYSSAVRQPLHDNATYGRCNEFHLPVPCALLDQERLDVHFHRVFHPAQVA